MSEASERIHDKGVASRWYGDSDSDKIFVSIGGLGAPIEAHRSLYDRLATHGIGVLAISAVRAEVGKRPSMHDYTVAVEPVIRDQLEDRKFVIGGISWGGVLAAMYANRHQDQVTGLAIIGSAPMKLADMLRRRQPMTTENAQKMMGGEFSDAERIAVDNLIKYRDELNPKHQQAQSLAFARASVSGSYRNEIVNFSGPTLIVCGQNDATIRRGQARRLVEVRKRLTLPTQEVVVQGGHAFTIATDPRISSRIADFVRYIQTIHQ